jgi:hypothetical protein
MLAVASLALTAGVLVAAAGPAGEAPTGTPTPAKRVAMLPVAVGGDVGAVAKQRIEDAFLRGLARGEVAVVSPTEVSSSVPDAATCADAPCLATASKKAGATHAVRLEVTASGRDYRILARLVGDDGNATEVSAECPICGFDEVAEVAEQQASRLATKLGEAREPSRLAVTTHPAGALVYVDGKPFGATPVTEQLPEGKHTVRVELAGYTVRQREVDVAGGMVQSLDIELEPLPRRTMGRGATIGGAVLLALGAAAISGGAALLAFHHDPVDSRCDDPTNIDVNGLCRWRYDTLGAGVGTLVGGVAGAVAGAVLLGLARRRARSGAAPQAWRAVPSATGFAVRF